MISAAASERIEQLLTQMTLEEKAGQLSQSPNMAEVKESDVESGRVGSVICAASAFAGNERQARVRAGQINHLQKIAIEKSRLGIPLIFARDVIHGHRTVAPIPLGQASSFSPSHVQKAAEIAAFEAAADGIRWVFTPMLDISRDPRWGRMAESYGEDPFLTAELAEATVHGLQGDDPAKPENVVACAKHFAGYGAVEAGRDYNAGEITRYTFRNIYLPPFHRAVKAGLGSIMSAFLEIGGVPATANRWLLRELLKEDWGFQGPVIADWDAVGELICHGIAEGAADAARIGLSAGVDIDMATGAYVEHVPTLVREGKLSESVVDDAVRRVLRLKFMAGLFDRPYADAELADRVMFLPASQNAVRELAERSIVLLKNEGLLPLRGHKKLGIFGPLAHAKAELFGTWTLDGVAEDVVTVAEALKKALPEGVEAVESPNVDESLSLSRFCDAVVVVVGEATGRSGENNDVVDIGLPPGQLEFLKGFKALKVPVVAVVLGGRALDLSWLQENVEAIVMAWHPGVMGGLAIADILTGKVNPSGKLPVTLPRSVGQVPLYYNRKATGRPLNPNERGMTRYVDSLDSPLYPFGYGLSYSRFEYSGLRIEGRTVSATVKNVGDSAGEEVVQLYVRDEVASLSRPVRELKGFERVSLAPGEASTVKFELGDDQLGYYGPSETWVVEPGWFTVWIGGDSEATLSGRFQVS